MMGMRKSGGLGTLMRWAPVLPAAPRNPGGAGLVFAAASRSQALGARSAGRSRVAL